MHMLFTLRLIYIFSAAFLMGSAIFNYFLLRPALRLIPPAHAVVVAQRGDSLHLPRLGRVGFAFPPRIIAPLYAGRPEYRHDPELYTTSYGRSLGFMILFWFLTVASST
jgi:hypothetical protein